MMRKTLFTVLFLLLAAFVQAQTGTLAVGAAWPGLALADQHDRKVGLNAPPLRYLLFAAERKPGDWAQTVIDSGHKALFTSGEAALVLDISRMPSMVTRMFALPSFRARTFPIILAREVEPVAFLPRQTGAVTLLTIDAGKIAAIDYASDEATLNQWLKPLQNQLSPPPTLREKP
jgi:hypothetical protein